MKIKRTFTAFLQKRTTQRRVNSELPIHENIVFSRSYLRTIFFREDEVRPRRNKRHERGIDDDRLTHRHDEKPPSEHRLGKQRRKITERKILRKERIGQRDVFFQTPATRAQDKKAT